MVACCVCRVLVPSICSGASLHHLSVCCFTYPPRLQRQEEEGHTEASLFLLFRFEAPALPENQSSMFVVRKQMSTPPASLPSCTTSGQCSSVSHFVHAATAATTLPSAPPLAARTGPTQPGSASGTRNRRFTGSCCSAPSFRERAHPASLLPTPQVRGGRRERSWSVANNSFSTMAGICVAWEFQLGRG